ncbi:hypothetical protein PG996_011756 [Apiospora saccharicola]|uniref:Uncharacterized protein n=1 Tax=Apiospora saccharicola TaxID=335842 RepID=A0ABR1UFZ6_9PEZI
MTPQERFGLSCSFGGTFYICQDSPTQFLGCCNINPCGDNEGICPPSSLLNSTFSKDRYDETMPEACVDEESLWYTCSGTVPPFMGCCRSNPCIEGRCLPGNFTAAKLSSDLKDAAPFLTTASSSSSSPTSSPTASSTTSPTPAASSDSNSKSLPVGAIVGIVIGAVLAIAIIAFLIWRLRKSKKTFYHPPPVAQVPPSPQHEVHTHNPSGMYSPYKDTFHNNGGTTPTTLVNSSATTTPRPPESFYDAQSVRTYSAPPPSPHGTGSNQSHWSPPSVRHSRVVSSHSSLGSEYAGNGGDYHGAVHPGMPPKRYSGQHFQPISEPISELAGSEVTGPQGSVSEIGWSDRDEERYIHQRPQRQRQQQRQTGLGIK